MPLPKRLIREAEVSDIPALLSLYQHLIPGDAAPEPDEAARSLSQLSSLPGSAIFLAETGGQVVATCTLVVIPNLTRGGRPFGLIENVVTQKEYRGQGHGKALLAAACVQAWDKGCYKVMLLTGSDEPSTHAFYRKAGFEASKTGYQMRWIPKRKEAP